MSRRAIVFHKILNCELVPTLFSIAIIVHAAVVARHTGHGAGYVYAETMVIGIYARGAGRRPVRLSHMDRKVSRIFEILYQRIGVLSMGDSLHRTYPVDVPVRTAQDISRRGISATLVVGHPEPASGGIGGNIFIC